MCILFIQAFVLFDCSVNSNYIGAPAQENIKLLSSASCSKKTIKISTELCPDTEALLSDAPNNATVLPSHELRLQLAHARKDLTARCEKWQELQSLLPIDNEEVSGAVCAVLGMANLLLTDKLVQVSE